MNEMSWDCSSANSVVHGVWCIVQVGCWGWYLLVLLTSFFWYEFSHPQHPATLPAIKSSDAVIVDRLSKPDTLEQRDARLEEKIDWKRQIEDTKRTEQTESEDEQESSK